MPTNYRLVVSCPPYPHDAQQRAKAVAVEDGWQKLILMAERMGREAADGWTNPFAFPDLQRAWTRGVAQRHIPNPFAQTSARHHERRH